MAKVVLLSVGWKVLTSKAKAARAVQSAVEGLQRLTKALVRPALLFMFNLVQCGWLHGQAHGYAFAIKRIHVSGLVSVRQVKSQQQSSF